MQPPPQADALKAEPPALVLAFAIKVSVQLGVILLNFGLLCPRGTAITKTRITIPIA